MSDHDDLVERLNKAAGYNGATVGERQALLREAATAIIALREQQFMETAEAEVARLKGELDEIVVGNLKAQHRAAKENTRLRAELAEAHRLIDIALEYEGDVFGVHHNDAVDFLCRNSLKPDGQKTGEKG